MENFERVATEPSPNRKMTSVFGITPWSLRNIGNWPFHQENSCFSQFYESAYWKPVSCKYLDKSEPQYWYLEIEWNPQKEILE